jgi:hypothetical protein
METLLGCIQSRIELHGQQRKKKDQDDGLDQSVH